MTTLTRRVAKLEAAAAAADRCPDPFHATWHVVKEDDETGQIPAAPTCPTCGAKADQVIVIEYAKDWRAEWQD